LLQLDEQLEQHEEHDERRLPMGGTGVIGAPQLLQGLHHGQGSWPIGGTGVMGGAGITGGLTSGGPGGRFMPSHVQGRVGSQNCVISGTNTAQHGQGGRRSPIGGTGVIGGHTTGGSCPMGGTGVIGGNTGGGSSPMGGTGVAGGRGLNIPPRNRWSASSIGSATVTGWYSTGVATDGYRNNGMVDHPLLCNMVSPCSLYAMGSLAGSATCGGASSLRCALL